MVVLSVTLEAKTIGTLEASTGNENSVRPG